jgi:hypothetical protein
MLMVKMTQIAAILCYSRQYHCHSFFYFISRHSSSSNRPRAIYHGGFIKTPQLSIKENGLHHSSKVYIFNAQKYSFSFYDT